MDDSELMRAIAGGDMRAFDELYKRYSPRVQSFLFKLCWDTEKASDWKQEVFYRVWKSRAEYRPVGKLSTWLLQIAKNLYLSELRKTKCRPSELPQDDYRLLHLTANARTEPEVHLLEEYRRFLIRRAIDRLPEQQRMVFILAHLEALPYAEIADILQIPEGTVKSRLHNAIRRLRSQLEDTLR